MDDTLKKLGKTQDADQGRDAIHIAVLTMEAQEVISIRGLLYVEKGGQVSSVDNSWVIGIVDPFLPVGTRIAKGQWFYVYLRPGSISGLKHVWTHEDLPEGATSQLPEAPEASPLTPHGERLVEAKKRVEAFCAGSDMSLDYYGFIQLFETGSCENFSWEGDGSIYSGDEEVSSEVPLAILRDVELLIGRDLAVTEDIYFRCAC